MTREFSDELISAYLDGQLPADERAEVEAHLAANPASQRLLAELRTIRQEVQALPTHKASANFADRVVQAALAAKANQNATVSPRSAGSSRRVWSAVVLAGVAAVAAAITIMVWPTGTPTPASSPVDAGLAQLKNSLPAEGEAVVVRIRVPAGVSPNQAMEMALASAGISQRSPADNSTGAIQAGAAYRKQLADKFGGQQPGVPNTALNDATTAAEEAVFVEATWQHLEQAVTELATLAERPLEIAPLTKVAAARPAGSNQTGGESEPLGHSANTPNAAPQEFAQPMNPRLFRLEKSPAAPVAPAIPPPSVDPQRKVRVLILLETAEK